VNTKFKINKHLKIRNPKFKLKTKMNNFKNIIASNTVGAVIIEPISGING
jgi:acetylornithine/succinyldiaminopimelate/putrescine aminotransferase